MAKRDETREHPFDELARGAADGTLSRSRALKVGGTALLGGVLSLFALPSREADAARRRQLKTLWAVIDMEGNLVRAKGATRAVRNSAGTYEVSFNRDVGNCAYGVTPSEGHPYLPIVDEGSNSRSVTVYTTGNSGLTDSPFHLQVTC